ncbi:hypothetical protein [Coleofasciculus sp. F4-SAH-05]|uniref:hypothetical protein n=1 Tax=Coleofasciculus sp. F4-SAH-05 TaxID=3069525 RepID=UPI0032FC634F
MSTIYYNTPDLFRLDAEFSNARIAINGAEKTANWDAAFKLDLKGKISGNIEDVANPGNFLIDLPLKLAFTNLIDGATGRLIIDNSSTTKYGLLDNFVNDGIIWEGDYRVNQNGRTILDFIYDSNTIEWSTTYKEAVPIEYGILTLRLSPNGVNDGNPETAFLTLNGKGPEDVGALNWVRKNILYTNNPERYKQDSPDNSVIIEVEEGIVEQHCYLVDLPEFGITLRGLVNTETGAKPVFNTTRLNSPPVEGEEDERTQFSRCCYITAREISLEDLGFRNLANLITISRNSTVSLQNVEFFPESDVWCIDLASSSRLKVIKEIKISTDQLSQKGFIKVRDRSSASFSHIGSTGLSNYNAGLIFSFPIGINFENFIELTEFSSLKISDQLQYVQGTATATEVIKKDGTASFAQYPDIIL